MYVGYNCILVTRDGAQTWKAFSPDLTTPKGQPLHAVRRAAAPLPPRGAAPAREADADAGPRPAATTPRAARRRPRTGAGRASAAAEGAAAAADHLRLLALDAEERRRLDRQQQRPDLQHDGRRRDVDQRHQLHRSAAPNANFVTVEAEPHDVNTAYVVANVGGGRGGGAGGARRAGAALHLSHARRRQDVDAHRQRPAERRAHRQPGARASAKIRNRRACSSSAPRRPSTCRSTMAITGSRCG